MVLALACNSVMAIQRDNLQTSMELVARNYSADLKNLILYEITSLWHIHFPDPYLVVSKIEKRKKGFSLPKNKMMLKALENLFF